MHSKEELPSEEEFSWSSAGGHLYDSKMSRLDDVLNERLEEAFHHTTSDVHLHEVAKIACEYSPIDLAYAAFRLPREARPVLYENLPSRDAKVEFMINTDGNTRTAIFRVLSQSEIKELIQHMPADEAVWVLENLPSRHLRRLLTELDAERAERIRQLMRHDPHSAGRLMTDEFFAFPMDLTIGRAAAYIRNHPGIDLGRRIFVLNRSGQLLGYVPSRNLIINPRHLPLRQVMQPVHHKVHPETSREEVVDLVERYKIAALPVVDENDLLVGVLTFEDVVEAIEDIADETIAQMAGTAERVSEHEPTLKRFLSRAPWLIVTLCGGLVNAASMSYFEGSLSPWLAFAVFFVPLITGMSGNVGVQCSTVLVRGMATGSISLGGRREAMLKEISIGLITGVVFGLLCGIVLFCLNKFGIQHLSPYPAAVATIVSTGLFGACLTATLLGVFSPIFFVRIGVDPAVSSGPIVTACNDVLSMAMYFLIAGLISHFFSIGVMPSS